MGEPKLNKSTSSWPTSLQNGCESHGPAINDNPFILTTLPSNTEQNKFTPEYVVKMKT